jgi:predicted RNase H-like HicB family nuclease
VVWGRVDENGSNREGRPNASSPIEPEMLRREQVPKTHWDRNKEGSEGRERPPDPPSPRSPARTEAFLGEAAGFRVRLTAHRVIIGEPCDRLEAADIRRVTIATCRAPPRNQLDRFSLLGVRPAVKAELARGHSVRATWPANVSSRLTSDSTTEQAGWSLVRTRRSHRQLEGSESDGYSAYAPDVPGVVAAGATEVECEATMRDAIAFHIEGLLEDGEPIPEPSALTATYVDVAA